MMSKNSQNVVHHETRNEPKIAMSFHRNRLKYYAGVYLLILFILYKNFDG